MKTPRGRSLNLADAMILVAATAVGMSLVTPGWSGWLGDAFAYLDPHDLSDSTPQFNIHQLRRAVALGVNPILLAWTFALLAIRLRRPRPSLRKLARQPGMIASYSAAVMGSFGLIVCLIRYAKLSPSHGFRMAFQFLDGFSGPAVMVAWLTLRLGGRWRPEPGPIDALGRIVGAGWVAMYLVGMGILMWFP